MRALGTTARHLLNSVATLPWLAPKNKLGGLSPSVFADFGRDKYALANVSPNLVVNGDFKAGLGNWTVVSGTASAANGVVRITGDGSGGRISYQLTGLVVGRVYSLTLDFVAMNGTNVVYAISPNFSSTATNADVAASTSALGPRQFLFVATGTTRNILIAIGNAALGNYVDVGPAIVREVTSTLGPNLVRNGDFATDLTGWTDASTAPATVVWSGSGALTSTDGVAAARLRQTIVTIPGRTYVFSHTGGAACAVGTSAGGQELLAFKQTASRTFIATGTATYVSMATSGNALTLDDVSVREVLVGFGPELVANSGFDNDLSGWTDASAAGASFSWQSGRAVASTDGVAVARLRTSITTVVGRTYVVSVGGSGGVLIGTVIGQNDIMSVGGNLEKTFVATTTTTYVSYSNITNGIYLDFVSVREVLTNQPLQPVTLNELISVSSGAKNVVANDNTLKVSPANYPAFDYSTGKRRLLLEGAATNLIIRSVALESWTASSVTVTQGGLSPDGVNNWRVITDATTSVVGNAGTGRTVSADTATYVYSMRLLKDPSATNNMQLVLMFSGGTTQDCRAVFNPRTGVVGATINCTSESIDFGAYCLIRLTAANNGTNTTLVSYIMPAANAAGSPGYSQSVAQTGSVSVLHAQLEVGTAPSSPILTNGSTATRVNDICLFSPLLNLCITQTAATMAYRANIKAAIASQSIIGLTGWPLIRAGIGTPASFVLDASSTAAYVLGNVIPGEIGAAFGWDSGGRIGATNGAAAISNPVAPDKPMPPFAFGPTSGLTLGSNYAIGAFVVWPTKASNSNIQQQARVYA